MIKNLLVDKKLKTQEDNPDSHSDPVKPNILGIHKPKPTDDKNEKLPDQRRPLNQEIHNLKNHILATNQYLDVRI